jgi:hypothetical protein
MKDAAQLVARAIRGRVLVAASELELQAQIADELFSAGIWYERERHLGLAGTIDFYVPEARLGVEIKVDGSPSAVLQQLFRYAGSEDVRALLLVTTRATHRGLGGVLQGKPIDVCFVVGGF